MREEPQHLVIKIYASFYSFVRGQISVVGETDWGRQRRIAILTRNFFSWPYHAVLSSRHHLVLLLLNWRPCGLPPPAGCSLWLQAGSDSRLTLTSTDSNCLWNLIQHLHISFHNAHDFRSTLWLLALIYSDASWSGKSLIDGSVKGHYATLQPMENSVK